MRSMLKIKKKNPSKTKYLTEEKKLVFNQRNHNISKNDLECYYTQLF